MCWTCSQPVLACTTLCRHVLLALTVLDLLQPVLARIRLYRQGFAALPCGTLTAHLSSCEACQQLECGLIVRKLYVSHAVPHADQPVKVTAL